MSSSQDFNINFNYQGQTFSLVKGEQSTHKVEINGVTYALLGDADKLEIAYQILNSVSLDSLESKEDLKKRLSVVKDLSFPTTGKMDTTGTKTLGTRSVSTATLEPSRVLESSLESKTVSHLVHTQESLGKPSLDTCSKSNHVSDVVFSHFEIPAETLQIFTQYLNSQEKEKKALEHVLQQHLPLYKGASVEDILKNFVENKLGMKNFQLEPINIGLSGALVYKVIDNDDKSTRFFIKMFKENTEILAKEVVSLNVLRQLPLRNSTSPHPMGVGKAVIDKNNYSFFAQTVAKGTPVTSLMAKVGNEKEGSQEREAALKNLEIAIKHVGHALAELWSVNIDRARHVGSKVREEYLDELIWTTHDIEEISRGISEQDMMTLQQLDLQAVKNAAVLLKERISSNPELFGIAGYEHTDTNPENLFFDSTANYLTLIDTEGVLKSVDEKGAPIGFPMRDKLGFGENSLPQYAFMKGMTEKEIRPLISAFHDAYNSAIATAEKEKGSLCSSDAVNMMMLAKHSGATLSIFLKLKDGREIPERLRRHLAYEISEINTMVKKIEATRV
jgi:hypothetical protein